MNPARVLPYASGLDYEKLSCFENMGLQELEKTHYKLL